MSVVMAMSVLMAMSALMAIVLVTTFLVLLFRAAISHYNGKRLRFFVAVSQVFGCFCTYGKETLVAVNSESSHTLAVTPHPVVLCSFGRSSHLSLMPY